jgi:predicted enzyme related to lactoylglutathione lyase
MGAAEAFYGTVVGWTVSPFDGAPQPYHLFSRPDGTAVAGVMTIPEGMNFPPHWEMYIGVPALDGAVSRIEQLGGRALSGVIDVPAVGRMRTMLDPQGAVFAVHEPADSQPPQQPPVAGDVSWLELFTTDADAALKFYTQMFGWTPGEAMDMGEMGKYQMFGRGFPMGGMMKKPDAMSAVPPHWGLYFRVPDVHAGAERVKANGGQVLNGPMEVPGSQWVVNCLDPQGAAFSLHHA